MINYKDNFIYRLLDIKAIKGFSRKSSIMFYDGRIKELFRKQLSTDFNPIKYYFTETTMKRVHPMDLTSCYPTKLGYLYDKYPNEIGVCTCNDENIGLLYHIGLNDIKIVVTSGLKRSAEITSNKNGTLNYYPLMKTVVGSAVINFGTNKVSILPNNTLSMLDNGYLDAIIKSGEKSEALKVIHKIRKFIDKNKDRKLCTINKSDDEYLYYLFEDMNIKEAKIWKAIKMFIFLKTASIIDKTFISDTKLETANSIMKDSPDSMNKDGVIVVDANWDSSINVINPFSVSGHFREQPKKNEKKEWYKEIIYIDAFMKTGYNRKAKIIL